MAASAACVGGASAQSTGELNTLVILATWGPQPWDRAAVQRAVFDDAAAFLHRSSFGQVSLHGDVTPWLPAYGGAAPACPPPVHERVAPALAEPPTDAASRAGYAPASYDRVIYVIPQMACPWQAVGVRREVLLNGVLSPYHVVHELGHTFELAHAHGRRCPTAQSCRTDEYGDPLSPMGRGMVDFSAYEKFTMGWLKEVARARDQGTYRIGRPDVLAATPHALVVQTARGEYWLEQRLDVAPPVLAVRLVERDVAGDDLAASTMFERVVGAGETFALPGAFSARYVRVDDLHADVLFSWTDRVAPSRPVLRVPSRARVGRIVRVTWSSREAGSGVAFCVVRTDARAAARIEGAMVATIGPLAAGRHRVEVTCTDRAGNRSRSETRRVRVLRG